MRLLLVEDDAMIGETLVALLGREGHVVDWLHDGQDADMALHTDRFDLVLLDLGLPRRDGIEVLRRLRARGDATPVLVLTARDAVGDRVAGLDAGADDYLLKPFDFDELQARMRALQRRTAGSADGCLRGAGLCLQPGLRQASRDDIAVSLSSREWAVLDALLARPGAVLSRADLEARLYGWSGEINSNAVEVYVHGLRRKLGSDHIETVRGLGYRFVLDPQAGPHAR
jgi:two-component system OmpR family response regulator